MATATAEITGTVVRLADGTEFVLTLRPRTWHRDRGYNSKSRVYGATDALAPAVLAQEPRYVAFTNADSSERDVADEKAWLSWRRRALTATTKALRSALPALAPVLGASITDAKFSYNAGCSSCPCSPGYVLNGVVRVDGVPADVFITAPAKEARA